MIEIKIVSDLETARDLWQTLSPRESIYDLWDFRYCFYKHDPQPLYFYVAYDDGQPVALLPLQDNQELACLEFFAENFMEDNRPFFKPGYEYLEPRLFDQDWPRTVKIYDLKETDQKGTDKREAGKREEDKREADGKKADEKETDEKGADEFIKVLPLEDYIYFLDVNGLNNFDDYLLKAFPNGHKRANFKRLFALLERDHEVKVVKNDFNDLTLIMDLNVKHFGAESYLRTAKERQPFYDLLKLPLNWQAITIVVDGVKLASSLSVVYNDTYYYLIVGSDIGEVRDVFKYLTKANLESAIAQKVKIFDCSLGDCNWKNHWHMDKRPQFKFIKLLN